MVFTVHSTIPQLMVAYCCDVIRGIVVIVMVILPCLIVVASWVIWLVLSMGRWVGEDVVGWSLVGSH